VSASQEAEVLTRVVALQNRYVNALDEKDLVAWAATFVDRDEASYICRSAENEEMGWPIALMLDDCRARILDRITFVTQIWAGTFQEYRTRHFTQIVACERASTSTWQVRTNFSIEYTFDPNPTMILTSGVYADVIEIAGDDARFVSKRAIYDTTVLPQYIVYPF
jgi:anthranilate 1,2-dioxygenase small subunit